MIVFFAKLFVLVNLKALACILYTKVEVFESLMKYHI